MFIYFMHYSPHFHLVQFKKRSRPWGMIFSLCPPLGIVWARPNPKVSAKIPVVSNYLRESWASMLSGHKTNAVRKFPVHEGKTTVVSVSKARRREVRKVWLMWDKYISLHRVSLQWLEGRSFSRWLTLPLPFLRHQFHSLLFNYQCDQLHTQDKKSPVCVDQQRTYLLSELMLLKSLKWCT